jgi:hypothetical protein
LYRRKLRLRSHCVEGGRMKGGSIAWIDGCESDDDSTQKDYFELLTEEDLNEFTDLELGLLDLVLRTKGGGGAKKGKKGGKKKGGGDDGGDDADDGADDDGGATSGSGSKSIKGRLSDWLDGKKEELAAVLASPEDYLIDRLLSSGGGKKKKKKKKKGGGKKQGGGKKEGGKKEGGKKKGGKKAKASTKVKTDPEGYALERCRSEKTGKCDNCGTETEIGTFVMKST